MKVMKSLHLLNGVIFTMYETKSQNTTARAAKKICELTCKKNSIVFKYCQDALQESDNLVLKMIQNKIGKLLGK